MNDDTINVKTYKLKDGEYYLINEIDYNGRHYLYLSNKDDRTDLMLRRVNGEEIESLDSDEEILEVLKLIIK